MHTYDEKVLVTRLRALDPRRRLIFAAACATRLSSGYLSFHQFTGSGDPDKLQEALDSVWDWAKGQKRGRSWYEQRLEEVMRLIPGEDEVWTAFHPIAEDATSAVAYALRTLLSEDPQEAAWAALCVYETLDTHLTNVRRIDVNKAGAREAVVNDPLIQIELSRQDRDLRELAEDSSADIGSLAEGFKIRAESEQIVLRQN